jgi:hypothetical protein
VRVALRLSLNPIGREAICEWPLRPFDDALQDASTRLVMRSDDCRRDDDLRYEVAACLTERKFPVKPDSKPTLGANSFRRHQPAADATAYRQILGVSDPLRRRLGDVRKNGWGSLTPGISYRFLSGRQRRPPAA